ncbi:site-2 protease family protein [bacterium]|nr:site-2 protease family protein [bacterium]
MFNYLPQIVILIFSVIFHEVAHGWMALRQGDNTARAMGRLTLNPVPHIDLFGTIILPLILVLSGSRVLFGWAKPVPINPWNMRDPRKGEMLVSAAGPGSNLLLAVIAALMFRLVATFAGPQSFYANMIIYAVAINLVLCVFNLFPIPPLDGSHILMHFLPREWAEKYSRIGRYGIFILFFLLYFDILDRVLYPIVSFAMVLLLS